MLETSHSQRLNGDLAAIRLVAEMHRGESDAFDADCASLAITCLNNLNKCDRAEDDFVTAPEINAVLQKIVDATERIAGVTLADWQVAATVSDESKHQFESLTRMRTLFNDAVMADEPDAKELKSLAALLIRGEKQLFFELQRCGAYYTQEQADQIFNDHADRIIDTVKPRFSAKEWPSIIERIADASTAIVEAMTNDQ